LKPKTTIIDYKTNSEEMPKQRKKGSNSEPKKEEI
jgi:hypothetical protein